MDCAQPRPCVLAAGLRKAFGANRALRGLDLSLDEGEWGVIVGANGSGKTTLLRCLSTLLTPSGGQAYVGGHDCVSERAKIRQIIGVTLHTTLMYDDLSVSENLRFFGQMFGIDNAQARIAETLRLVGLSAFAQTNHGVMSRGLQQRAALARAVLHDPRILLLDEPDTGLDQDALELLDRIGIDRGGQRRTVLMSTHDLRLAQALADRVFVLCGGRVQASMSRQDCAGLEPEEFAARCRPRRS